MLQRSPTTATPLEGDGGDDQVSEDCISDGCVGEVRVSDDHAGDDRVRHDLDQRQGP
jgi:hypothetical protein